MTLILMLTPMGFHYDYDDDDDDDDADDDDADDADDADDVTQAWSTFAVTGHSQTPLRTVTLCRKTDECFSQDVNTHFNNFRKTRPRTVRFCRNFANFSRKTHNTL